jgi:hypothetical protein
MHIVNHIFDFFSTNNPYVVQTLFAFASLLLGMLGMIVGQRLVTNHRLGFIMGLAVGIGMMVLLATPYGYLAPGWCLVFVVGFLGYNELNKIIAAGRKKDAAKTDGK